MNAVNEESSANGATSSESLSPDEQFLLEDIIEHHGQSSWDWGADRRFAEHIGADYSVIDAAMASCAPFAFRVAAARSWKSLTARRLRGLRSLVKRGKVESYWLGTGSGGATDFGVRRVREYCLAGR